MARFETAVASRRSSRWAQALVIAIAVISIVVIGVADYAVGIALSLSVFYFIPVAVVTVGVSGPAGLSLAALAAFAWMLADALKIPSSALTDVGNGVFRFGALSFVVALLAALRRAVQEARASEQRSKEFLAYAAHQLRSPLAGLRASAEALVLGGQSASPAQRERLATNLTTEADRMGRLVRSLLRLTRLDAGAALHRAPCDVRALLGAEIHRMQVLAPHLDVELAVASRLPDHLLLDRDGIAEIVANLLDNARRHAASRVDVTALVSAGQLGIRIEDDGPGLPAGTEQRAFDRFVSLDAQGGSGLGLSIARSIATAHGGTLEYAEGGFVVAVPATYPRPALPAATGPPEAGSTAEERVPTLPRRSGAGVFLQNASAPLPFHERGRPS